MNQRNSIPLFSSLDKAKGRVFSENTGNIIAIHYGFSFLQAERLSNGAISLPAVLQHNHKNHNNTTV